MTIDRAAHLFTEAAVLAGLIQQSQLLTEDLVDSAGEIVTLAACIADRYPNPSCEENTVGDYISGALVRGVRIRVVRRA